ncbi:MAG: hypothetical protein QXM54_04010, partial [Desulfurococcaceae archaeon]
STNRLQELLHRVVERTSLLPSPKVQVVQVAFDNIDIYVKQVFMLMGIYGRSSKEFVSSRDQELSEALESLIREELMMDLENAVKELVNELDMELDFEPVKAKAFVSGLVREMRDERESRLLRQ